MIYCPKCNGEGLRYDADGRFGPCAYCAPSDNPPGRKEVPLPSIAEVNASIAVALASCEEPPAILDPEETVTARVQRNRAATLRPPLGPLSLQAIAAIQHPPTSKRGREARAKLRAIEDARAKEYWQGKKK